MIPAHRERSRAGLSRLIVLAPGGVTRLELFVDLVFVYAFFNVTALMSANFHPVGLLQGGLVVLLLWRCWASYASLGNLVRLDRGIMPLVVLVAAASIFVVGVTLPEAFADRPHGLPGPLVFVVAFLLARLGPLLIATFALWNVDGRRPPVRRAWLPLFVSAPLLLFAASLPLLLPAWTPVVHVQLVLFAVAVGVDYVGLWALGAGTWQLTSAGHWAERYSLIVLIALGGTIISIGTSRGLVGDPPITWSVIIGSVLGIVVVAVLWWTYFDLAKPAAEQALQRLSGGARSLLGRDAYTMLHLPMIGGLILLALGLKHALSATEERTVHQWDPGSALALYGGVALYLLGLLAFERRGTNLTGRSLILGIALLTASVPLALRVPAVASLAILAAAVCAMVVADRTIFRQRHRRLHRSVAGTATRVSGVWPHELFLDLLIVYAFIQVTVLMSRQPSAAGAAQGLGVVVLLWWSWCYYAWLGSATSRDAISVRVTMLVAAALTLVLGIAIPQAFSRVPGGLPGPLIVVTCYAAVRILHFASFWLAARADPTVRAQLSRAAVPAGAALALLLCATLTFPPRGSPVTPISAVLWGAALAIDLGGGYLIGPRNWQIRSLDHWVERYNLVVLIAFGEAVSSTGVALVSAPISPAVLLAITLSVTLLATLWWTYVGTDELLDRRLRQVPNSLRAALARDAYTYLHLLPVAGLILIAFGLKSALAQLAYRPTAAPDPWGHTALYGGVIVYLLGDQLIWQRAHGRTSRRRMLGVLLVALTAPATARLPGLGALVLLTAVGIGLATTTPFPATEARHGSR
ncbi:hypothetical protein DKT69_36425 [Micromonospora sicca]|uniref:Low temperature requirement protein A n=1 Tax=Micromonospora sicca TaxID=2202420 RepID=A0A317CYP1_9ACTN|nr:hypothetical protein DKT69_36425 [Micromonospora sp. 4G51]